MNCRFRPASNASASCERPRLRRSSRNTIPNRFSGVRNPPLPEGEASYEGQPFVSSDSCRNSECNGHLGGVSSARFSNRLCGCLCDPLDGPDKVLLLADQLFVLRRQSVDLVRILHILWTIEGNTDFVKDALARVESIRS